MTDIGGASNYVPGHPTGRVLSFLVDTAAIAALAQRQASADAAALVLGQALADDVVGNVLSFIGALPATTKRPSRSSNTNVRRTAVAPARTGPTSRLRSPRIGTAGS